MKRSAIGHTKLKKLQKRLGLPSYACVGILEMLWHLTGRESPQGNIGRLSNEDIAIALDWDGDHDYLIENLVDSGWIDVDDEYRLVVHDWHDHADDTTKKYLERNNLEFVTLRDNKEQKTESREMSRQVETKLDKNSLPLPLPLPLPKETTFIDFEIDGKKPLVKENKKSNALDAERIYKLYPRKVGHGDAVNKIEIALRTTPFDELLAAVQEYAESEYVRTAPRGKIPHPSTWFHQKRWTDDREEWKIPYDSKDTIRNSKKLSTEQTILERQLDEQIKYLNSISGMKIDPRPWLSNHDPQNKLSSPQARSQLPSDKVIERDKLILQRVGEVSQ